QTTNLIGLKKPFVWVNRDGVCFFNAFQKLFSIFCQDSRSTISSVNMKPDFLLFTNSSQFVERVHGSRIGGSCRSDKTKGLPPLDFVFRNSVFQFVDSYFKFAISRDNPDLFFSKPQYANGFDI